MKVSDYIVSFFANKGITDAFGYPGGMVTHLIDSFEQQKKIKAHVNYHEQASAFAACGYAQIALKPGLAYATSGPGATNLITGICNAYFDSIPCIFITGQVNTFEAKGNYKVRQRGFQETDIVEMVKKVTKEAYYISDAAEIPDVLEKAYRIALEGRPGPVLLDIPMNIQRTNINELENKISNVKSVKIKNYKDEIDFLVDKINAAKKPLILCGAGITQSGMKKTFQKLIERTGLPVVTSMVGVDSIPNQSRYAFGFIGAYGHRYANFIVSKCDLLITIGSRMDCRQTGADIEAFAQQATIIRMDIDPDEMTNKIKKDEIQLCVDLKELLPQLLSSEDFAFKTKFQEWLNVCSTLKNELYKIDQEEPNKIIEQLSDIISEDAIITTDVGQNQVWIAQSFKVKADQRIIFSGGHGAMGYSLPAAIGAYYASQRPVIAFVGDGGFMMNIQELEFIKRENLPIKIVLLNNHSLGMIRHFQEMYFNSIFAQTTEKRGYQTSDFEAISKAFGIDYLQFIQLGSEKKAQIKERLLDKRPLLINIELKENTYVYPKLEFGKPIEDQEPAIDRKLFEKLQKL